MAREFLLRRCHYFRAADDGRMEVQLPATLKAHGQASTFACFCFQTRAGAEPRLCLLLLVDKSWPSHALTHARSTLACFSFWSRSGPQTHAFTLTAGPTMPPLKLSVMAS
eukprot:105602-Pelagomonas_calceolata.AAC.6